jgi:hypothetical protein
MSGLLAAKAVALTLTLSQRERGPNPTHGCLRQRHLHDSLSPWERAGVRATASHANPLQRTIA